MKIVYVINRIICMAGIKLVHQILEYNSYNGGVIDFNNFYTSFIDTVKGYLVDNRFQFFEYDMNYIESYVSKLKSYNNKVVYTNCMAVVHTERRILSTEKIRTRTNWTPSVSLDMGLDECIEYYIKGE